MMGFAEQPLHHEFCYRVSDGKIWVFDMHLFEFGGGLMTLEEWRRLRAKKINFDNL